MPSSKALRAKKREYYKKNIEKIRKYTKIASDRKKRFKLYYQENKQHIKKKHHVHPPRLVTGLYQRKKRQHHVQPQRPGTNKTQQRSD